MQWKHKVSPTPMKFCVKQLAGKIMTTVFWDSEGVLRFEFMPHKTTITGDTYASTMVALCENIKQKCRGKLSAGVLLFHDNAPTHKSSTLWAARRKCGFEELNHPPYRPDLGPSNYWGGRSLSVLQSRGTTLKNNEVCFMIRFNFHAEVDNLLNSPHI